MSVSLLSSSAAALARAERSAQSLCARLRWSAPAERPALRARLERARARIRALASLQAVTLCPSLVDVPEPASLRLDLLPAGAPALRPVVAPAPARRVRLRSGRRPAGWRLAGVGGVR